jgi:hypothetical protein
MEHKSDCVFIGETPGWPVCVLSGMRKPEAKKSRALPGFLDESGHRNAQSPGDGNGWRLLTIRHNQKSCSQVAQVELELLRAIGWVERRRRGSGRYGEKRSCHLGTVVENDRYAITDAYAVRVERMHGVTHELAEAPIYERNSSGRTQRTRLLRARSKQLRYGSRIAHGSHRSGAYRIILRCDTEQHNGCGF